MAFCAKKRSFPPTGPRSPVSAQEVFLSKRKTSTKPGWGALPSNQPSEIYTYQPPTVRWSNYRSLLVFICFYAFKGLVEAPVGGSRFIISIAMWYFSKYHIHDLTMCKRKEVQICGKHSFYRRRRILNAEDSHLH